MLSALQARIRIVQSPSNARVKALRRALEMPPSPLRPAPEDRIAAEGFHLLREALQAGIAPEVIFMRQGEEAATLQLLHGMLAALPPRVRQALLTTTDLLALPPALLSPLLDTVAPQPVAALLPLPAPSAPLPATPLVLTLCGLQDPGNVGTLLRSALAFGATDALLVGGTASPWSGKSLRASAGAAFHLPIGAVRTAAAAQSHLQARGIHSYAAVPRDGQDPEECPFAAPSAIWIGNEGAGLTDAELAACERRVSLPMPGGAESLNAAIAGSLLLYEAARHRSASKPL